MKPKTFQQSRRLESYRRLRADEKDLRAQISRLQSRIRDMQQEANEIRHAGIHHDGLTDEDFDAVS